MATIKDDPNPDLDVEATIKEVMDDLGKNLPEGYGIALIVFCSEKPVGLRVHASSNLPQPVIGPVVAMVANRWIHGDGSQG